MKTYNTLNDLLNSFPTGPPDGITFAYTKAYRAYARAREREAAQ